MVRVRNMTSLLRQGATPPKPNALQIPLYEPTATEEEAPTTPTRLEELELEIAFINQARGLTNLRRGYRTPDPSPNARDLPKCAATNCVVQARSRRNSSRTPSPLSTGGYNRSAYKAGQMVSSAQQRYRTPSPDCAWQPKDGSPMNHESVALDMYCVPFVAGQTELNAAMWPPGVFYPVEWEKVASAGNSAADSNADSASTGCPEPPEPFAELEEPEVESAPPSLGSVGHSLGQCAEACKYFWKARGCKDAANCNRCHLCQWKQIPYYRAHRRQLKGKARMEALESGH